MRFRLMNSEKWLFIGTDLRLSVCKEHMSNEGKTCKIVQTDTVTEELESVLLRFQPDHIVFSIGEIKGVVPVHLLANQPKLYVGNVSKEWLMPFQDAGLVIQHYLQEELFVWENAHITAEAFLREFYEKTHRIVRNTSFHIAGFGRVGKMTAQLVQAMGGKVTILARTEEQLAEAKMLGYKSCSIDSPLEITNCYVVNTIPAKWLKIEKTKPLFVFDLASAPGCLVDSENHEYYKLLPRLPGKHFPIDAALVLKEALDRMNLR